MNFQAISWPTVFATIVVVIVLTIVLRKVF